MQIAILGAGAMGMLFGGYLSRENEVTLIDVDEKKVRDIWQRGVTLTEPDGSVIHAAPTAVMDSSGLGTVDLVIIFVKAMFSHSALETNRHLIGPNTYLMTLQNGAGHEEILREFAPADHVIIGTTQHNSSVAGEATVHHGGSGPTVLGLLEGDAQVLRPIAENFTACGFETDVSNQIRRMIWEKLFTNVSASVLTGVLQTRMGFLVESDHAWNLTERLLREAVRVANADGMGFDEDAEVARLHEHLTQASGGYTSIYADLRDGHKTEVDTISGSVVRASRRTGVPAPSHEIIVELVHALEDKKSLKEAP